VEAATITEANEKGITEKVKEGIKERIQEKNSRTEGIEGKSHQER
jgi:hypothetical protein